MTYENTKIKDVLIIEYTTYEDERGLFFESYNKSLFDDKIGKVDFIQDNQSISKKGVIRGLHYQMPPFEQSKLVRVIKGAIIDVVVDIRKNSPTFAKHIKVELNEDNKKGLFIPEGFAHGFISLCDDTIVVYKVDKPYAPTHEEGIVYDDESLDIDWGMDDVIVSNKDKILPSLDRLDKNKLF